MKKGAQARRSEQNARRRRGKREDGIAAGNERTNGRATLARAASARVDEMVRGEQSIRHHAFLLSARAQCVLYIPRAAVLLLLDRAKAENAPSFLLLLLLRRPFRYLRYSDTTFLARFHRPRSPRPDTTRSRVSNPRNGPLFD